MERPSKTERRGFSDGMDITRLDGHLGVVDSTSVSNYSHIQSVVRPRGAAS